MNAHPAPYWPYPFAEAEMIRRYGMRPLTPNERQAFPGLPLALDVFKARLTRPPAAGRARAGWVIWIAETYPDMYLARLPGGAPLPVPYNEMAWERVPPETPATSLAAVRLEEERLRLAADEWRPGRVIVTPGTRLRYACLDEWLAAWAKLVGRRETLLKDRQERDHIRALPAAMITAETEADVLYRFLQAVEQARLPRGRRGDSPLTPLVVAAHNQLARLGATPYRQYLLARALVHERDLALPAAPSDARPSAAPSALPPHLNPF
jgi:hypothetical protein